MESAVNNNKISIRKEPKAIDEKFIEIEHILNLFNLPQLIPTFRSYEIDKECFLLLNEPCAKFELREIIPEMNLRIKFRSKLEEWKQTMGYQLSISLIEDNKQDDQSKASQIGDERVIIRKREVDEQGIEAHGNIKRKCVNAENLAEVKKDPSNELEKSNLLEEYIKGVRFGEYFYCKTNRKIFTTKDL